MRKLKPEERYKKKLDLQHEHKGQILARDLRFAARRERCGDPLNRRERRTLMDRYCDHAGRERVDDFFLDGLYMDIILEFAAYFVIGGPR